MFGRKSRRQRLEEQLQSSSFVPFGTLSAIYAGARPVIERLLYDDDLRDNIRDLINAAREISDEVSDEKPAEIVSRLWNDDKLRKQVEAATVAAQQGSRRVQGKKVRSRGLRGRGGRWGLILLAGGAAFLFMSPQTGPEARRVVRETVGAISSR